MDCDRVFALLTAAPFPTGEPTDGAVERHLLSCPECRRLAEALRPCEADAPEALPDRQRRSLPSYHRAGQRVRAGKAAASSPAVASLAGSSGDSRSRPGPPLPNGSAEARLQVAAFTLAPKPRSSAAWEAFSLGALLLAVALGCWGLGLLAM